MPVANVGLCSIAAVNDMAKSSHAEHVAENEGARNGNGYCTIESDDENDNDGSSDGGDDDDDSYK